MKRWIILAAAATSIVQAQMATQMRRATMTGSRGENGKCTIEVRVDGGADVEIAGETGRLITTSGQPATWSRMECSDPMPRNPQDFRFQGVDGRGDIRLVRDPRNNRGVAVVHIEDPKGGSEGYTFDIEWTGTSGGFGGGGLGRSDGGFGRSGGGLGRSDGGFGRGGGLGGYSAERAIDLCRNEVRARAERDYGLRNIDIVSAAADNNAGRRDWIVGTFVERRGRGGEYRFGCSVDFNSGMVRNVEIQPSAGSSVIPRQGSGGFGVGSSEDAVRTCQDAVVSRINRDGYRDVNFGQTGADNGPGRNDWIVGTVTARRGNITDTFQFGCAVDFRSGRVRSVEVNRR